MSQIERFARQFMGVVLATLVPVVLLAFTSIPMALGGHPGEQRLAAQAVAPASVAGPAPARQG